MENQKTIQCDGEEWLVEVSEHLVSEGGSRPKRRILRFSRESERYSMNVSADMSVGDFTDQVLCRKLASLRGSFN